MSTYTIDTSTSRANPTLAPMRRLTVPKIMAMKGGEPIVMLTAYTARMAQLLDPHCDLLLVGDSLGTGDLRPPLYHSSEPRHDVRARGGGGSGVVARSGGDRHAFWLL
jgi:hypothetical protein